MNSNYSYNKRSLKVLILSYETFNNVGEEFLGDSTKYLVNLLPNCQVDKKQLVPSYRDVCKYNKLAWIGLPIHYFTQKLGVRGRVAHHLWKLVYRIRLYAYYKDLIKKFDKIVIAVGMLKFKNQNFSYIYDIICRLATEYNKEVLFNAMSIAKEDENDLRFHQLVDAINKPCVKGISTRDGEYGLNLLKQHYIRRPDIRLDEVGDPALWIPEIYNVKKNMNSTIIGVNLISPSIFTSYGYDIFTEKQVESLYADIIDELDRKGYEWFLYSNGMKEDYAFGERLITRLSLSHDKLLPCPTNATEYLQQLIKFKAIFGARLHADISAVALEIPVVGILWDGKLKCFGYTMGIEPYFMNAKELNGRAVIERLEKAMAQQLYKNKEYYKEKTKQFICLFVANSK